MSNNYLQFSEMIENLTDEERAWIEERIEEHSQAYEENALDWDEDPRIMDFGYELEQGGLWVYSEEWANLDCLFNFVQAFLKNFRPNEEWFMSWAEYCSRLRVGEFGGGTAKVTADGVEACFGQCIRK